MTRKDIELVAGALGRALAESRWEGDPAMEQGARTAYLNVASALTSDDHGFDADNFVVYVEACAEARAREMDDLV